MLRTLVPASHWARTFVDSTPAVWIVQACGHGGYVYEDAIDAEGRFMGRLQCSEPRCKRIDDDVFLEEW